MTFWAGAYLLGICDLRTRLQIEGGGMLGSIPLERPLMAQRHWPSSSGMDELLEAKLSPLNPHAHHLSVANITQGCTIWAAGREPHRTIPSRLRWKAISQEIQIHSMYGSALEYQNAETLYE